MAKGKGDIKGWITKNGVHIPIYGHYSVRGGEEPQSKGARWGKSNKKKIKELGDRLRQKRSIGYKDLEEYMNQPGSTLEANYRDWRGDESYYVTNKDDDGEGITVTKAAAQKYIEKNRDNLDSKRAGGEYEKSFSKKSDNAATEGESDASKGKQVEGKGAIKDVKGKKAESGQEKDKYADRDWNKDVDDAKRYGYSEQTETGKKPVTKAEEKGKTIEVNGKKINVKPGETNSQAIYRQAMEEQGKPVDKQFYDELVPDAPSSTIGEGSRKSREEAAKINAQAKADGYELVNKGTGNQHWEKTTRAEDFFKGQESSTPDMRDETKTLGDGGKVTPRIKAQEQAYVDDAFKPQVSEKERKMQELRDAERAYVNEAFEGNTKQESSASLSQERKILQDMQKRGFQKAAIDRQAKKVADLKSQGSSTPDFSKMSYSEAGQYVADHKKDFGLSNDDDAYLAAYQMKKGKWKGASTVQENRKWADDTNRKTMVDSPESSTSRTPKLVAPTEEMKRELGIDKDYGYHNVSAAKEAQARYKKSANWAKQKDLRYAQEAQKEKAKAQSIADAISGATGIANSGSIQNMSPSGLKSAYAEATGARKTKIGQELRKRGYQFTGGKWVKKKS